MQQWMSSLFLMNRWESGQTNSRTEIEAESTAEKLVKPSSTGLVASFYDEKQVQICAESSIFNAVSTEQWCAAGFTTTPPTNPAAAPPTRLSRACSRTKSLVSLQVAFQQLFKQLGQDLVISPRLIKLYYEFLYQQKRYNDQRPLTGFLHSLILTIQFYASPTKLIAFLPKELALVLCTLWVHFPSDLTT